MSGHSKWATIKHKKGAADAKRGKLFAKLIRQVEVAARNGGGDPDMNPTLRTMFQKARDASVPLDTIERAIKRGTGELEGVNYEEVTYEGYAPGGVAVFVEALTDNRNRTASNVRALFTKYGGNLGESGSVAFMFTRVGEIAYPPKAASADAMLEAAIEAGAEDVQSDAAGHVVTCTFESTGEVSAALAARFGEAQTVKVVWKPQMLAPVDQEKAESLMKLAEALDEDDDVQNVFTNVDIPEDVMARLNAA